MCEGKRKEFRLTGLILSYKNMPSVRHYSIKNRKKMTPIILLTFVLSSFEILNPIGTVTGKAIQRG